MTDALKRAIAAYENDPHGGKVMLSIEDARALLVTDHTDTIAAAAEAMVADRGLHQTAERLRWLADKLTSEDETPTGMSRDAARRMR